MEKETYLTFLLGKEYFAVNVNQVLEVLEQQTITKIPCSPEHVLGIINFRGDILPVIDMRQKFHLQPIGSNERIYIIIYETIINECKTTIAATADSVNDVIEITQDEIKSVPELGMRYDSKFITGAIRRNDVFILMLDIDKVFLKSEAEVLETI